jgi:hypothetical protein
LTFWRTRCAIYEGGEEMSRIGIILMIVGSSVLGGCGGDDDDVAPGDGDADADGDGDGDCADDDGDEHRALDCGGDDCDDGRPPCNWEADTVGDGIDQGCDGGRSGHDLDLRARVGRRRL